MGAIARIECEYLPDAQELYLHLYAADPEDDCELELWSLNLKKDSFEAAYGLKLTPVLAGVPVKKRQKAQDEIS